jgi:hypothetical protein
VISADHFREELQAQLERASARGYKHIVINALELHVALGVFPGPKHHTAEEVMDFERTAGDVVLVERAATTGLTIRYLLPRMQPAFSPADVAHVGDDGR